MLWKLKKRTNKNKKTIHISFFFQKRCKRCTRLRQGVRGKTSTIMLIEGRNRDHVTVPSTILDEDLFSEKTDGMRCHAGSRNEKRGSLLIASADTVVSACDHHEKGRERKRKDVALWKTRAFSGVRWKLWRE